MIASRVVSTEVSSSYILTVSHILTVSYILTVVRNKHIAFKKVPRLFFINEKIRKLQSNITEMQPYNPREMVADTLGIRRENFGNHCPRGTKSFNTAVTN